MNGRLYEPLLRRFLKADENIQEPHNTQNYNKYGYVYNNPLMYNDPSGEFAFLIPILGKVVAGIIKVAVIGAAVGLASYTVGLAVTGNLHHWNIGGALKATFWGAVSGVVSFGVGELFSSSLKTGLTIAKSLKASIGEVGLSIVQAGTHAISQGVLSVMQGGSFEQAFWSGALGSLGASGWNKMFGTNGASMIAFGALSGGIGAELSGGNFWEGAVIGGVVAGLNHAMHRMANPFDEKTAKSQQQGDPWDLDGDGRISLDEANNWYRNGGGKSITLDASKIDLNSTDTSKWQKGSKYGIQTLFNSKEGRVLGNITVEYLGNNQVRILPDIYNFEMHGNPLSVRNPIENYDTWIRNTATFLGRMKAGSGMQYKIYFRGINTIKPR